MRVPVAAVLAVVGLGCMDEKVGPGEATPIVRTGLTPPPGRPPPPAPKPDPAPVPVAPVAEAPPSEPAGLTRTQLGDLLEFSWSRVGEARLDENAAMAVAMGAASATTPPPMPTLNDLENMKSGKLPEHVERAKGIQTPKPSIRTGTLTLVRVEPELPFTFRVEIKSGKDVEAKLYTYGPDVPLHKVLFRADPDNPKKKAKAAGTVWDCVESPSRLVAPDAAALALSGGLVSETSPETTRVGAVSVALTKVGRTKPTAGAGKPTRLDTFETPIAIAMQQVAKFGIVDPLEKAQRDEALQSQIVVLLGPCVPSLKPKDGNLEGVIAGGKLESLLWNGRPAPKAFEKCARQAIKKLKLPAEQVFLNIPFGAPVPLDSDEEEGAE